MIEKSICININGGVENSTIIGSCQNEIRFRSSEDQLKEEILQRRKAHKWYGALHCPCTKCGSYSYVFPDITTISCECEQCFAKRRYREIVANPKSQCYYFDSKENEI